jgi:hypothetical protein
MKTEKTIQINLRSSDIEKIELIQSQYGLRTVTQAIVTAIHVAHSIMLGKEGIVDEIFQEGANQ